MKFKAIILFLLIPMMMFAQQSRFSEGETLYVWALSGLNMRKLPDAKSEKIAALTYGTKVTVQPNIGIIVAHEVEEFKDFKVKGIWLLVRYGDKEGFVFDGYMSRLVAPKYYKKGIENYLDDKIGNIGEKYDLIEVKSEIDEDNSNSYKQKYQKEIIYEHTSAYETDVEKITLPNLTLFEGYILLRQLYHNDSEDLFRFDAKKNFFETRYILDQEPKNVKWDELEGGCEIYLKMIGKTLVIEGVCGF
jgi:hypothetical protein